MIGWFRMSSRLLLKMTSNTFLQRIFCLKYQSLFSSGSPKKSLIPKVKILRKRFSLKVAIFHHRSRVLKNMAVVEKMHRSENSLEEVNQSSACHLNRSPRRISGAQSFDMSSRTDVTDFADIYLSERNKPVSSSPYSHRNGFSKSMVDLSSRNGFRKSVMFEEDLYAHKEMLQRARNRFKELELKYPEIFKNSTRTSSLSSTGSNRRSRSFDRSESLGPKSVEHQEIQTTKTDTLQVLQSGTNDQSSNVVTISRTRPPPLSVAMKLHNLEDSCDSAFDEIDRESVHSKTSHEPTPTSFSNSHFLYPGESVESDKDSGISTDRPCTPNSRSSRPLRWIDPRLSGTQFLPQKSKSLTALSSGTNSQELTGSDSDSHKSRSKDRRGILKSVAYRNQEIQSESLDIPTAANSSTCSQQRHNQSGSLSGQIRRGKLWSIFYCCCWLRSSLISPCAYMRLFTWCLFI